MTLVSGCFFAAFQDNERDSPNRDNIKRFPVKYNESVSTAEVAVP
jgi:hypothetical protein